MNDTESVVGDIEESAEKAGAEAGRAAGSWIIDGNTTEAAARLLLKGIEDGDPEVMDALPSSPLSGEWADAPSPSDILERVGMSPDHEGADDVLAAFEAGYDRGVVEQVTLAARALVTP